MVSLGRNGSLVSSNWGNAMCYAAANGVRGVAALNYLDSPATTSAVSYTYVCDFSTGGSGVPWYFYKMSLTLMEIAA